MDAAAAQMLAAGLACIGAGLGAVGVGLVYAATAPDKSKTIGLALTAGLSVACLLIALRLLFI